MFRDDAVVFLTTNCQNGALEHIEFEHHIDGPGNWIFGYATAGDIRIACVGRNSQTDKPEIKWDMPA